MARRASSAWWIANYGKPCIGGDQVKLEWYPGVTTVVHEGTELLWQALGAVMVAYNYQVPTSYTGSYSCRNITGGKRWSGHAWPVAMDINAKTNPYRRTPTLRTIRWGVDTDMPAAMVTEIESITASGVRAFGWGGRWRSIKDAMHYQIRVTLGEIAGGVKAPRGFYGGGGTAPGGDDEMSLKKGDKGNAVTKHQKALIVWNSEALPKFGADGDFGSETDAWVKNYQKAADLEQNGVIDGVTSALLISYLSGGGKHSHTATASVAEGTTVGVTIGEAG